MVSARVRPPDTVTARRQLACLWTAVALVAGNGYALAQAESAATGARLSVLVETFAQAQESAPPPEAREIRTLGYHTSGEGGGACYARLPHDETDIRLWQLECSDGSRWQLAEVEVTPLMFGARPLAAGATDDRAAFQAAFDCAADLRRGVYVPPGRYWISGTIVIRPKPSPEIPPTGGEYQYQKPGPTYRFDRQAMLRAMPHFRGEAMIALGDPVARGDASWEAIHRNSTLFGGVFDCNGEADVGIWITFCNDLRIYEAEVRNFRLHGFRAGSTHAAQRSYGAMFVGCKTTRDLVEAPAGSAGIYFRNCGDSHALNCTICGVEVGVGGDDVWDSKFTNCHVWNSTTHGDLLYGFDVNGDNVLSGCQVDGPFRYAYRFRNLRNSLEACNVNYESTYGGKPDHATVIRIEPGGGVTAMNCNWKATSADPTVPVAKLKAEVEGDTSRFRSKGNKRLNVDRYEISRGPDELCLAGRVPGAAVDGPVSFGAVRVVNIGALERRGPGVYEITANNPLPADGPLLVTVCSAAGDEPLVATEDTEGRTHYSVRIVFHNLRGERKDPKAFSVAMYGAG